MQKSNIKFWLIGIISIIFMIIILWFNYQYAIKLGKEYQGIFGDMFGASNALFTGLSFTGLIITILLQRQEIIDTKIDLRKNNSLLYKQQFESTFFSLLNLYYKMIPELKSTTYSEKNGVKTQTHYVGREVFQQIIQGIYFNTEDNIETYYKRYGEYCNNFGYKYLHYIRHVFQILIFIDGSRFDEIDEIDIAEKKKYVSILREQLSCFEISLIFYHAVFETDRLGYKNLIEKYSILQNLDDALIHQEIKKLYSEKAFITI